MESRRLLLWAVRQLRILLLSCNGTVFVYLNGVDQKWVKFYYSRIVCYFLPFKPVFCLERTPIEIDLKFQYENSDPLLLNSS